MIFYKIIMFILTYMQCLFLVYRIQRAVGKCRSNQHHQTKYPGNVQCNSLNHTCCDCIQQNYSDYHSYNTVNRSSIFFYNPSLSE